MAYSAELSHALESAFTVAGLRARRKAGLLGIKMCLVFLAFVLAVLPNHFDTIQAQNNSDSFFTNGILICGVADGAWRISSAYHAVCCLSLPKYVMSLQAWQFLPDVSKRLYDSNMLLHARGFILRVCIINSRFLDHI